MASHLKERIKRDAQRADVSTRWSYGLIALAIAALVVGAIVFVAADLGPPDEPPVAARTLETERALSPCSGLEGRELERCQTVKQERPGTYEQSLSRGEVDASSNAARIQRGTGVEGVSSAGTTGARAN